MSRSDERPSEPAADEPSRLSEADALAIERACDRFEQAWSSGTPLAIETVLEELPDRLRGPALRELVAIEVERRTDRGERVSAEELLAKHPGVTKVATQTTSAGEAPDERGFYLRDPRPGDVIGDYELQRELGSGGMGTVYLAYHQRLDRQVALKSLLLHWLTKQEIKARFNREVRAAAHVHHPNLVVAFDAREQDGRLWLVTEYLKGTDLQRLVKENGPLPPAEALQALAQAARGLEAAHRKGLVHRDVKPANLFLTDDGTVKVLDLGLSRFVSAGGEESDGSLTATGAFLGTPNYVSPEQARDSRQADQRSDVYSLGCTLYYLLTGEPPFSGPAASVLVSHATSPLPSLPDLGLPPDRAARLKALYDRMTAKSPGDRYASMDEVVQAIEAFDGEPRSEFRHAKNSATTPMSRGGAYKVVAALAGLLVAAAIVFGIYAWTRPSQEPVPGPRPIPNADTAALSFDGWSSYVELTDFDVAPDRPATVEAVVRPRAVRTSNLVSWMGPDWIALYLSGDGKWGVAKLVGDRSLLLQTIEPATLDRSVHLAGSWDGERLRLYVDGVEVPTEEAAFTIATTEPGLFIGGVAEGRLPANQADRFFDGVIDAVRISGGAGAVSSNDLDPKTWIADESTLVLLRFSEGSGDETLEEVSGRAATVHSAEWTASP